MGWKEPSMSYNKNKNITIVLGWAKFLEYPKIYLMTCLIFSY